MNLKCIRIRLYLTIDSYYYKSNGVNNPNRIIYHHSNKYPAQIKDNINAEGSDENL